MLSESGSGYQGTLLYQNTLSGLWSSELDARANQSLALLLYFQGSFFRAHNLQDNHSYHALGHLQFLRRRFGVLAPMYLTIGPRSLQALPRASVFIAINGVQLYAGDVQRKLKWR